MEQPPALKDVISVINTLHYDSDPQSKQKASLWLDQLQKSVHAWKIADELLREKPNLEVCYFAAQTMRSKIQFSFHELPQESYVSLKDSLMDHLSQVTPATQNVIVTQLCLALTDLALQMADWKSPVADLIRRFGSETRYHSALLELLKVLPEEINSKNLRLGSNRRNQLIEGFQEVLAQTIQFLRVCVEVPNIKTRISVFRAMGSWFSLPNFPEGPDANQEVILKYAFLEMSNPSNDASLHDAAAECICNALVLIEDSQTYQSLATILFEGVYQLFPTYHNSVSNEEIDKDVNYCKIFTDLGESVVVNIIEQPNVNFGNLQTLDILLTCVGHYDYEVAEKTFHFWYTFSELLFKKNNEVLNQVFEPYIKRLIVALCRQCQLDTDHEGIPDERDDFCSFRLRVSDLIKDIIFIVGSSNVFIQMFENLKQQGSSATWDVTEASLFIMASVAKNILPSEREIVPQVLQALLNIPPTSHISILHTSCLLIRELSEWLDQHPEFLEPVIQFLMAKLRQRPLATAAADALQNLCSTCRGQMRSQFARLLEIVQSAESLGLSSEATQGLLKAATSVLIQMPHNLLSEGFCQLCNTQLHPLSEVLKSEAKLDPCMWVDNIAIIFRTAIQDRLVMPDGSHPCKAAVQISWPVLSQVLNKYRADVRMAERLCRCLRFLVRCIGRNSDFLLEPLVTQIVQLYQVHFHSCFLYLGSILVDEYGGEPNCHQGLLSMLQAMCSPTFQLLKQPGGFREHPDTVDDLFRLCARFLLRCPLVLLQNPELLMSVVSCGMAGASLDHKEANASVMKFFLELARCGHSRQESPDFPQRRNLVLGLLHEHGQSLVSTLLKASLFDLPTYVLPDIADVLFELVMLDQQYMEKWLGEALQTVPLQGIVGPITVTSDQLLEFHYAVSNAQHTKVVSVSLREFARLFK